MELRPLIKKAWNLVWQNPFLWLLGLFSIFFNNNEFNLVIVNFKRINNWIDQLVTFNALKTYFQQSFSDSILKLLSTPNIIYYFIFAAIIITLFLFLSLISQIFIVFWVKNDSSFKIKSFISKSWRRGLKKLFPIIGIRLITFLIIYSFLLFLSLPFFYKVPIPIIIYIIIFLLALFLLSFIARYATFFIIINNEKFLSSFKKGVLFFLKNWLKTIEISVILSLTLIFSELIFFFILIGSSLPISILLNFVSYLNHPLIFLGVMVFLATILSFLFILINSILSAFQFSVWTLFFIKSFSRDLD